MDGPSGDAHGTQIPCWRRGAEQMANLVGAQADMSLKKNKKQKRNGFYP